MFITGCYTEEETLEIPLEIDGKKVIGVTSLKGKTDKVKHLVLSDTIEVIGESALYGMNVETVTIGSNVKYLDVNMFARCQNLAKINVSDKNPDYCDIDGVVYNKQQDRLIVYPLAKGNEYTIPDSVTNIDVLNEEIYSSVKVSFAEGSKGFVTVDGVTYNATQTKVIFCDQTKTGSYVMPDTVSEIAANAFAGCSQLQKVEISRNVTSIAYHSFADCTSLTEVVLPQGLEKIDSEAFERCQALTSVSIPNTLREIGTNAFSRCKINAVYITDLANWCEIDFSNSSANPLACSTANLYLNGELVNDMTIPDGVTRISDYAFYGYRGLTSLTLPDSLQSVGAAAFVGCGLTSLTLPDGVARIGNSAFYNSSLVSMTLPDSVESVGNSAFYYCKDLQLVDLGKGIHEIGDWAFRGCAIKKLTIPASVKWIGKRAFYDCTQFTDVIFEGEDIEIGDNAFECCPLKEVNLNTGIKRIGEESFQKTSIETLTLPNGVTEIAYRAFGSCWNLSEIDIPTSVVSMNCYAFDGTSWYANQPLGSVYLEHVYYIYKGIMPEQTEIDIKDGTRVIADGAFSNFSSQKSDSLIKVNMPYGLETIGKRAFRGCSGLTEVDIPSSVSLIGKEAFYNCSSLTAINVDPENAYYKSVDGVLFSKDGSELIYCPKRTDKEYEVPEGVQRICGRAFSDSGAEYIKISNPDVILEPGAIMGKGIICPVDSTAYTYAKRYKLPVKILEEPAPEPEPEDKPQIVLENSKVFTGHSVSIDLKLINNPGFSVLSVGFIYDTDYLTLTSIENKVTSMEMEPGTTPVWVAEEDYMSDGTFATLTFEVAENAPNKDYEIKVVFMDAVNDKLEDVIMTGVSGMLSVSSIVYGDANGDGKVNAVDLAMLRKYLANRDPITGESSVIVDVGADVNGDGKIGAVDLAMLRKYLANKDPITGESTVILGPRR